MGVRFSSLDFVPLLVAIATAKRGDHRAACQVDVDGKSSQSKSLLHFKRAGFQHPGGKKQRVRVAVRPQAVLHYVGTLVPRVRYLCRVSSVRNVYLADLRKWYTAKNVPSATLLFLV